MATAFKAPKIKPKLLSKEPNPINVTNLETRKPENLIVKKKIKNKIRNEDIDIISGLVKYGLK